MEIWNSGNAYIYETIAKVQSANVATLALFTTSILLGLALIAKKSNEKKNQVCSLKTKTVLV